MPRNRQVPIMTIRLSQPLSFSCIGKRAENQDRLWPAESPVSRHARLFVVCDGMGGADRGEVASQLLAETVGRYVAAGNVPVLDAAHLNTALDLTYEAYGRFLQGHPLVSRMGSTLALVQFHERGVTMAHMGDSRVFWVRGGQVLFSTKDHRRVNELVEAGILTPEQAQNHPWRNRLSRAVVRQRAHAPTAQRAHAPMPDVVTVTDLQPGDYFFLCTDGVLETIDHTLLATTLAGNQPDETKLNNLLNHCNGRTQDNYSGFLLQIAKCEE
jgi:PPM family protein phosphatase